MTRWRKIEQFFKHRLMHLLEEKLGRTVISPDRVDWKTVRRLLVIRPQDQMGDFLLSTPALRALHNRFPEAHIGIVVKDYFADTMLGSLHVDDRLIFCRTGKDWTLGKIWTFWTKLRTGWDLAVVLSSESHSLTSDVIAWLSRARWILGSSGRPFAGCTRNFLYNLLAPEPPADDHQSVRNLAIVRHIGADTDDLSEVIHVTDEERQSVLKEFVDVYGSGKPVIGFHIGANKFENRWPVEKFVDLARRLKDAGQDNLIVFWGPAEQALADAFFGQIGFGVHRAAPSTLRRQIIHFSLCDVVVCNDTGVMHLCAATGTPLVAIFGPTDPTYWKPVGDRFIAVRSPSHKTPDVAVEAVFDAVMKLLKRV